MRKTLNLGRNTLWGVVVSGLLVASACGSDAETPIVNQLGPTVGNGKCYTPCRQGITRSDGTYLDCPADGLMIGCIAGMTCDRGTCVPAAGSGGVAGTPGAGSLSRQPLSAAADGGTYQPDSGYSTESLIGTGPTGDCQTDLECAGHQICISGRCASDCDFDADCRAGRGCYRHVCRAKCTASEQTCPSGLTCTLVDGQNGFCTPAPPQAGAPNAPPNGTLTTDTSYLEFTSTVTQGTFKLTNSSKSEQKVIVRKVQEVDFTEAGQTVVDSANHPLPWITLAQGSDVPAKVDGLLVKIPAGGSVDIKVADVVNTTLAHWEGELAAESDKLGRRRIRLSYAGSPEGHWTGSMFYFANFGTTGIDQWLANRSDITKLQLVGNAFIKRWGAFKQGLVTFDEFNAVLTATRSESWKSATVKARCPNSATPNPNAGCYLYAPPTGNPGTGIREYSNALDAFPIPSAPSELPIGVNIHHKVGTATAPVPADEWSGKIISAETLHYAGDPALTLTFEDDPIKCTVPTKDAGNCLVLLKDKIAGTTSTPGFWAQILVGGRYPTDENDTACSKAVNFARSQVPWLIPGFDKDPLTGATLSVDSASGTPLRYECRDRLLPLEGANVVATNIAYAASNPIADGRTRKRTLEFIDGVMVNQSLLFIIFREKFESFLGGTDTEGFGAYGYMLLKKSPDVVKDVKEFTGSSPSDNRAAPDLLAISCTDNLKAKINASGVTQLADDQIRSLATVVLTGIVPTANPPVVLSSTSTERVHYYCADTGLLDTGPGRATAATGDAGTTADSGVSAAVTPCPTGSDVEYFTTNDPQYNDLSTLPCQSNTLNFTYDYKAAPDAGTTSYATVFATGGQRGTCKQWIDQHRTDTAFRFDPVWKCHEPNTAYCDQNRSDLRNDRDFYAYTPTNPPAFLPLQTAVDLAFRYKTKFRNREGKSLGFTPTICEASSDSATYCYDPKAIQEAKERVDCALSIYKTYYSQPALDPANAGTLRQDLKNFLTKNFSLDIEPLTLIQHDGFERLNSELIIMLADESYTQAFTARYDLAGLQLANFQGSLLEPNGIDLSGGAGFEMFRLYQAAQYYQMVLDRFYALSPTIWASLKTLPSEANFVTQGTVTSYFDRLVRASAQKSRAWSEIAKRYQSFNRPDLARLVVQRAYTSAHLESIVLSRMMLKVVEIADPASRAQIVKAVEDGQRVSRQGMLAMRDVYKQIVDDETVFGYAKDYIPFPALDPADPNAFEKLLGMAKQRLEEARSKEQLALQSKRDFDMNQAAFESELVAIKNDADDQLGSICGTFAGDDGTIYPAITKYAEFSTRTRTLQQALGSPCGYVGNGQISDEYNALAQMKVDVQSIISRHQALLTGIDIERNRVNRQCKTAYQTTVEKCAAIDTATKAKCAEYWQSVTGTDLQGNPLPDVSSCSADDQAAGTCKPISKCNSYTNAYEYAYGPPNCDKSWEFTPGGLWVNPCTGKQGEINSLNSSIRQSNDAVGDLRRIVDVMGTGMQIAGGGDVWTTAVNVATTAVYVASAGVVELMTWIIQGTVELKQQKIADLQREMAKFTATQNCDNDKLAAKSNCNLAEIENASGCKFAQIDANNSCEAARIESEANIRTQMIGLAQIELDAVKAQYAIQLAASHINKLKNDAKAAEDGQGEALGLLANRAAAQTDPNTRIYKNDAILSADRTFTAAVKAAYKATKVFEYYTSQSYAHAGDLFLVRTVAYGDISLEGYLAGLEDAFSQFGEQYGTPDNRVALLSLRDDVLKIAMQFSGKALSQKERIEMFRKRLQDPELIDERGYLTIPFSTSLEQLSPVTRNHKISYIEAEMVGKDLGDDVGRVYLVQKGTGTVQSVGGDKIFYSFPARTAVVDTFFSGNRVFPEAVYQTKRMKDLPVANTAWNLVFNQRDEQVNKDINVEQLSDIRLYIYYTDFTGL